MDKYNYITANITNKYIIYLYIAHYKHELNIISKSIFAKNCLSVLYLYLFFFVNISHLAHIPGLGLQQADHDCKIIQVSLTCSIAISPCQAASGRL